MHPQAQTMRDGRMRDNAPQLYTLTVEQARAADLASIQAAGGTPEPVHSVEDRTYAGPAGDLPIRVYRPASAHGVLVYYFGGGWTLGSIDTSDGICRSLANAAGCTVVTPGYRLAPEHRFPAAVHDCYAALEWAVASFGDDRVAVGGDSCGGNLAAAVTLLARSRRELAAQLLVYPCTDYASDTASLRENTDPYLFNRTSVRWYWDQYLVSPEDGRDPLASPLRAEDLSGLPPALVITAEYDPLRDQGEEYADRLARSGVPVELTRYDGMVHGFFAMAGSFDAGGAAIRQAATHLRDHLARIPSVDP